MYDLEHVKAFAVDKHSKQMRRHGEPYVNHCIRVAESVSKLANISMDAISAAYLHDVLEDTNTTIQELFDYKFSARTVYLVNALTRSSDVTYKEYINDLIEVGDIELLEIKLADLNDNSIMASTELWEGWQASLRRYNKAKIKIIEALIALRSFHINNNLYPIVGLHL